MSTLDTFDAASQSKIAYFDSTIFINKHISRFKVTMKNFSRMKILKSAKNIIGKGLNVEELKVNWRFKKLFKVGLTFFKNDIKIIEIFPVFGWNDLNDRNKIRMLEKSEKGYFSENSLAVNKIVKEVVYSFNSDFLSSGFLFGFDYVPI